MSKKYRIDPVLFEKVLTKSQNYAKISKNNKKVIEQWFLIANDDIKITKLLFAAKHYAGATYHLQQAYEKLTKGYYILIGRLDPNEAVDHKFILKRLQKEVNDEDIIDIVELSSSMSGTKVDLKEAEKSLKILEKTEEELRNIKKLEIEAILDFLDKVEQKIKSKETLEGLKKKVYEKRFFGLLKHLILKITHFRVRDSEVRESIEEPKLERYIENMCITLKLHYLSLITFLHFNTPRYPYDKYSKLNFFEYNENFGIVVLIPKLMEIFEGINSNIEKEFV